MSWRETILTAQRAQFQDLVEVLQSARRERNLRALFLEIALQSVQLFFMIRLLPVVVVLKGRYLGEPLQLVIEVEMPEPMVELVLRRILEEEGPAHLVQVVSGGLNALLKFRR